MPIFGKAFVPFSIFKKWTDSCQAEHKKRLDAVHAAKSSGKGDLSVGPSTTANLVTLSSEPGATKEDVESSLEQARQHLMANLSQSTSDSKVSVCLDNVVCRLFCHTRLAEHCP